MSQLLIDSIYFLEVYYILFMKILLLFCIVFLILNLKRIISLFKGIDAKTWFVLILIILIGLIMRMRFIPHVHHVYFDEFDHINIAENILYQARFFITAKGGPGICETGVLPFWLPGYHTILSYVFLLFGGSENVAFNFSAAIGTLSIFIMFLITYLLFKNQEIALYSAILFNFNPIHLKYSGASELSITSLFFILLVLLLSLIYAKFPDFRSLLLLIFITSYTIYIRPENSILLFLMPIFVVINTSKGVFNEKKIYQHILLFVSLMFSFLVFYILHLSIGLLVLPPSGWSEGINAHFINFKQHIFSNLRFWFSNLHPLSYSIIAILGLAFLLKHNKRNALFFLIWFCLFLSFYSQYHVGDFLNNPDSDRYTLNLYVSLILFASYGLFKISNLFRNNKLVSILIISYLIIDTFSPLRFNLGRTFRREVYKEYQFVLSSKNLFRDNVYVISVNPSIILSTIHKMAVQPQIFIEMDPLPKEAILFRDYWWFQNDMKLGLGEIEDKLNKIYSFEVLKQQKISDHESLSFIVLKKK